MGINLTFMPPGAGGRGLESRDLGGRRLTMAAVG